MVVLCFKFTYRFTNFTLRRHRINLSSLPKSIEFWDAPEIRVTWHKFALNLWMTRVEAPPAVRSSVTWKDRSAKVISCACWNGNGKHVDSDKRKYVHGSERIKCKHRNERILMPANNALEHFISIGNGGTRDSVLPVVHTTCFWKLSDLWLKAVIFRMI
jgi:hypothetical protein